MTPSPGSRATGCVTSPTRVCVRRSTTSGTRSARTSPTPSPRPRPATDGKKYFIPVYNYPWGFFYRKSVWQKYGYEVPTTFDELKKLAAQMKKDGLIPIAFADKDGWPAMGTFDYLDMRLNGYQFHVDLCAHKESWDQQKVKDVFDNWKSILPYQDPNALGVDLAAGRRHPGQEEVRDVSARRVRHAAVHRQGRAGRHRLLRVPRDGDRRTRTRSRRRSTATCCPRRAATTRPPRICWPSSARPRAKTPTRRSTAPTSRRQAGPTPPTSAT